MTPHERKKRLDKIKKCLNLAKSSNEHEAAAAMRQAQAMMRESGLTEDDVIASEANESRTPSGAGRNPPKYETELAGVIAIAFGCKLVHSQSSKIIGYELKAVADWLFVGVGSSAELASYAFAVMFRQLRRARSAYIEAGLRRCKSSNKTRRADLFCQGWVNSVEATIQAFAVGEREQLAISAYMNQHFGCTSSLSSNNRNADRRLSEREMDDYCEGHRSGKAANLHRPMTGTQRDALESGA